MAVPLLMAAAAVSVFGKIQSGLFARKQGRIAEEELNLQADILLQQRAKDVQFLSEAQAARRGGITGKFAASGVDVNSGSAFDTLLAQSRFDSVERSRLLFESQLQARQLRFQGASARAAGQRALTQSVFSSFGSIANVAAAGQGGATTQSPTTPTGVIPSA